MNNERFQRNGQARHRANSLSKPENDLDLVLFLKHVHGK